ncbi:hypothetical protein [Xanthomonas campestris]|uniref:hypothetical protein n=1 Tax=Xanthomonas campestris TaxID=339 RepID=UPI0023677221|nr:hypothetical protein [Xanthomonas campestris]
MSKVRLITIGLMVATLAACSSGPSESKAEEAMLAYAKANGSEDAKLTSFKLGECSKSDNGGDLPPSSVPVITDKARG